MQISFFKGIAYPLGNDVRYFSKDIFPSGNFPKVFFQVVTSQICNLPSGNFQVCPSRSNGSYDCKHKRSQPSCNLL